MFQIKTNYRDMTIKYLTQDWILYWKGKMIPWTWLNHLTNLEYEWKIRRNCSTKVKFTKANNCSGRAQWLTPVIQHFGRPRWVDHYVKRSRPSWPTWWNPVSTKNTKIRWAWWCVPVVPATWEAEAGELLEPRRRRLRWAEITPLHASPGNKSETPSQKKKVYLIHYQSLYFY